MSVDLSRFDKRWCFLKASLLIKTYNDKAEDDTLGKHHLLPSLTLKKRYCLASFFFFLVVLLVDLMIS